jgi:hypothetical protein
MKKSSDTIRVGTVVIGAGFSGLSFGIYGRDVLVVGKRQEATRDDPFTFLHYTECVGRLLELVGISTNTVEVNISTRSQAPSGIVSSKLMRKDQRWTEGTDTVGWAKEGVSFRAFGTRMSAVCDAMRKSIPGRCIANANVVAIFRKGDGGFLLNLDDGRSVEAQSVISTVHYSIFADLFTPGWSPGNRVGTKDLLFTCEEYKEGMPSSISYGREFESEEWEGAVKIVRNGVCGMVGKEYENTPSNAKAVEDRYSDKCLIRKGVRFYGRLNAPPQGVIFAGRFATANAHWQLEDSAFIAQNGMTLTNIMSEQARFDDALVHEMGETNDAERAVKLVLHLYSEVGELLRELDWKMHKPRRRSKSTSVREELIDCIKLITAIASIMGFTEKEICDAFSEKSKVVWRKFAMENRGGV